jgi:disulfide bond formation protein DsbB
VLVLAFADQLWFRDLPCPLCILQRVGFIAAGFGIALNLMFGPRPSHYGLAIVGAVAGGVVSARQILLNIAHNSA